MTKKSVFRKAELNKYSDQTEERKVSWLELYFDLFFVVVLYYLVHELAYDLSLYNLFQYTLMFLSSLWLWMSYTYYKEVFQNHGLEIRIFTFFYMIPIASLAVFSSDFMDNNLTYYILSYAIARLMLSAAWIHWWCHNQEFRHVWNRMTKWFIISILFLILALFDIWDSAKYLFLLALLVDYIHPVFSIHKQSELGLNLSRLPERFGLFLIIVIWEIVRWVINSLSSASQINLEYISISVLLFALSYALWSIYFDYLPKKLVTKNLKKTFIWIYLHILIIYCLTIIGWVILEFDIATLVTSNPTLSIFLTLATSVFMILMWIIGKIVDGRKIDIVQKKRSSVKIYTWIAILIFWIIVSNLSLIVLLSWIVLLLLAQIIYVIHLWKHNPDF